MLVGQLDYYASSRGLLGTALCVSLFHYRQIRVQRLGGTANQSCTLERQLLQEGTAAVEPVVTGAGDLGEA